MTMHRQKFPISTDTGSQGDTGIHFSGTIAQMRWAPATGDTGRSLSVALLPRDADTGEGHVFYNKANALATGFMHVPRQKGVDGLGLDTGVDEYHPIVAAGDRLRVKVGAGTDTGVVLGSLYVWYET